MVVVTTRDVMERFHLQVVSGGEGLGRYIATSDLSRPGLEMAGYFMHYPADRVQLLGKTEVSFFDMLDASVKKERMLKLCSPDTPAIIIARGMHVPEALIEASNETQVPVLTTTMTTTRFSSKLTNYLDRKSTRLNSSH